MLDTIVRYLHDSLTPFRLSSYPSPEHVPQAVQPLPKHAVLVETRPVLVADKLALLCFVAGDNVDLNALSNGLDGAVVDVSPDDLPTALQHDEGPPPPLGQLYGLPVIIDERVTEYPALVFQPFGESDYFEVPYDDFARLEQPRVLSFARAGELPQYSGEQTSRPAAG
jgi:Ala-tRNA(Pro) deacylase